MGSLCFFLFHIADIFEDTAPFATSVLDGYNVCIFAYGQTGAGKTFTMEGTEKARGVNFRTLEKMFDIIKERQKLYRYDVSVSVLEVYNEQIRDLLVSGNQLGMAARRLLPSQSAIYVILISEALQMNTLFS